MGRGDSGTFAKVHRVDSTKSTVLVGRVAPRAPLCAEALVYVK